MLYSCCCSGSAARIQLSRGTNPALQRYRSSSSYKASVLKYYYSWFTLKSVRSVHHQLYSYISLSFHYLFVLKSVRSVHYQLYKCKVYVVYTIYVQLNIFIILLAICPKTGTLCVHYICTITELYHSTSYQSLIVYVVYTVSCTVTYLYSLIDISPLKCTCCRRIHEQGSGDVVSAFFVQRDR